MKAILFYRVAAILLLAIFTDRVVGFRQSNPEWGADALLASMQSVHFSVQGFDRSYWDLFTAAGFTVGAFYLFSAALAWQLSKLQPQILALMRSTTWAFALCFAAITILSYRYLFALPIVVSGLITACLVAAAWFSPETS